MSLSSQFAANAVAISRLSAQLAAARLAQNTEQVRVIQEQRNRLIAENQRLRPLIEQQEGPSALAVALDKAGGALESTIGGLSRKVLIPLAVIAAAAAAMWFLPRRRS